MPTSTLARGIAAATTCLLAAGLAAAVPAGASTHRATTYLHTTRHHTVVAPSTIRPGLARLHNSGKDPVIVVGRRSSAGLPQLVHDLRSHRATPSRFLEEFVIRDEVMPRQTDYLPVRRGTLYLVDARRTDLSSAAVRTVHVTGHTANAPAPSSRPVVIAADNSLQAATTAPHGSFLHLMNHSGGLQFVLLARISSSATKAQLDAFAAHPTLARLGALRITSFAPFAIVPGHHGLWADLPAVPARYGVVVGSILGHHPARVRLLTIT